MKIYNYKLLFLSVCSLFIFSCNPQTDSTINLGQLPDINDANISITTNIEDSAYINFNLDNPGCTGVWTFATDDPSKPEIISSSDFKKKFVASGDYECVFSYYNKAGMSESKTISFTAKGSEKYGITVKNLTQLPWVWDQQTSGHLGNGPADALSAEWWVVGPNTLDTRVYDNQMIFSMDHSYMLNSGGFIFCNGNAAPNFGIPDAPDGAMIPYEQPVGQTWTLSYSGDYAYLSFSNNGFPCYASVSDLGNAKYQIVTLDDNTMLLKTIDGEVSWFMQFTH